MSVQKRISRREGRRLLASMAALEPRRLLAAFTVDATPETPDAFTFPTIAQAVTAASGTVETDDTIDVVAGIYDEAVTVDTPVTLRGVNVGDDPRASSPVESSVIVGTLTIDSPGVSVDGFKFDGAAGVGTPGPGPAVHVLSAGATVANNVFVGSATTTAILVTSSALDAVATLTRNVASGFSVGVDLETSGTVTVSENDLENNGLGLRLKGLTTVATVASNNISGNTVAGAAIDLSTLPGASSVAVSSNTFNNVGVPQLRLDGGTEAEDLVTLNGNAITLTGAATYISITTATPLAGRSANTFTLPRTVIEDEPLTIDLALLDGTDVESVGATGLAGTANASDTSVTYTPSQHFNGPTSFTFETVDGAIGTVSLQVAAVNDGPTAVNIPPQSVLEDGTITLTLPDFFSDVDVGDVLAYTATGEPEFVSLASGILTIAPDVGDKGNYSFSVEASDGVLSTSKSISLAVIRATNPPPVFGNLPNSVTLAENLLAPVFDVSASDPDDDGISYSIISGNEAGRFAIDPVTGVVTMAGTLDAEAAVSYALGIRVTDNGEPAFASTDAVLTVNVTDVDDVATTLTLNGPTPIAPVEGQTVSFAAAAVDGDMDALLSYRWFVDGIEQPGQTAPTFDVSFGDEGNHLVRVEVSDRGGAPVLASKSVTVGDAAPSIPLSTSVPLVNEGVSFSLNLGAITDVDPDDIASIGQLSIEWGDGQFTVVNAETDAATLAAIRNGTPVSFPHVFDDGSNLDREIIVRLYDSDERVFAATATIRVNNAAPTGTFSAITPTVAAGSPAIVNWFGQTDISAADRQIGLRYTFAVDVNADGALDAGDTLIAGDGTYGGSVATSQITIANTFISEPGTYRILGLLLDKDGSPVLTRTVNVVVTAGTFRVISIGGDHSGFTVNFNRTIDRTPLNLWDGTDSSADVPDVVLTRANGQVVRGSLVFNAAGNGFDFIVTGGILPAGNYTVMLRSGNTGFQALDGSDLDGDGVGGAGGNYTAIFGVNAPPGPVLSAADFARGPGQPIDVIPGSPSSDLPIIMTSPIAISSLNFQIRYNSSLMTVTDVYAGSGLPAGWQVDYSLGTNVINVSLMKAAAGTANISSGIRELIKIVASVPNDPSIYGKSQMLTFATIVVNGTAAIEGTADRALHKVIFLGDANLDGNVNIGDAGLIQSVVLQNVTGFDSYSLIDPTVIVDSSRNFTVDAQDATNAALSGFTGERPADIPAFTPLPLPITVSADPTFSLPSQFFADAGTDISVPLSVSDDGRGIQAGAIRIHFDPSLLTLRSVPVLAGPLLASGWTILTNVNATEGWIEIAFYSGTALAAAAPLVGTLLTLQFTIAAGIPDAVIPLTIAPASNQSTSPTVFYSRTGAIMATGTSSGSIVIDTQAPVASQPVFSASGSRQFITVAFSEDLRSTLTTGGFELVNLTTHQPVNLVIDSFSPDGKTVTLTFADTGGVTNVVLTDGNYRFRVLAGQVADAAGNALAGDVAGEFFFLNGDVNHDRTVDFADLVVLAQNYNAATGVTFATGDMNYDGAVDFTDLVILAQRYGRSLAPPVVPLREAPDRKRRSLMPL